MADETPAWATSVSAFSSAVSNSAAVTTASQLQFPDTSQLHGLCGNLMGGSSFTSGLVNAGDPTQGTAGALVGGSQSFTDGLCGLMGGAGVNTTPQSILDGGTDVSNAVNISPMASGTIAMAPSGPSGNTALDAINGAQTFANSLYNILSGCGCGGDNAPTVATPTQVINTAQASADAVNNSPFASGIITMGQDPDGSGNVAVDAVNGSQNFANSLFGILSICGCGSTSGLSVTDRARQAAGGLLAAAMLDDNPYSPVNVSPQTIIDVATATASAVTANPFAADLLGGGSGNIAIDALTSGQSLVDSVHSSVSGVLSSNNSLGDVASATSAVIDQNTANLAGAQSLTAAQSVALQQQNLLVSQDFSTASSVVGDADWSWDGTDGSPGSVSGCAKVICDGNQEPLVSSEIPVVAGENIEVSCEVKWSGLTYTGASPLILAVEKFRLMKDPAGSGLNVYTDIGWYPVYTIPTPGSSSDWTGIAGTYTVEPGVDQLRFRLEVAPNATAGTVKWDAAEFLKLDLIANDCVPGVGQTTDSIVTSLYGTAGSGFSNNQAAVALANTAESLSSVTATVANLQAEGSSGSIAGDDFAWTGVLSNPNWSATYSADPTQNGHYAASGDLAWVAGTWVSVTTFQSGLFLWTGTDATSTTDYQLIQVVLDSAPVSLPVAFSAPFTAHIRLVGRAGVSGRVIADIGSDGSWFIGYINGGSLVTLDSGTGITVPGKGSIISFYVGDKPSTTTRHYRLEVGTTVIADIPEGGTGSAVGSSNRGWGFGVRVDENFYGAASAPQINQWLAQDQ